MRSYKALLDCVSTTGRQLRSLALIAVSPLFFSCRAAQQIAALSVATQVYTGKSFALVCFENFIRVDEVALKCRNDRAALCSHGDIGVATQVENLA